MAKKQPAKKTVKKDVIPKDILTKLKRVKLKFFKDDTLKDVREAYLEIYREDKLELKDKKWSDMIFHKRAFTKLKNKKKSEKLGGAVDKYYEIVFGASNVRDLSQNRRIAIIELWEADPQKAIDDGLIIVRKEPNPATGEIEKIPIYDDTGSIVPRDNIEFGKRKDGTKFKNQFFNHPIAHAYRRNVIGICSNLQGIKGIFIQELRDKSVELDIPLNVLVKSSGRTLGTEVITLTENIYIDRELLEEMIENLEDDIEQEKITEEFANEMKKHYTDLLSITKKKKKKGKEEEEEEEEKKEIEVTLFKLRSTKGTAFIKVENEKEFEIADFPMRDHMQPDINLLYKKYFYPFTSDCSNLLKFHKDHRFIDGDPEQINWDEFVSLQDVNLIQMNMEASMAGNYTFLVEDESLFNKDVSHLDEDIDAIKILVPSHVDINYFAQDSKLNVIGSPVQFQAQDEDRKEIWETKFDEEGNIETDEEGNEIKIPVMGFPLIMISGIYPIPEYIEEVETVDLTLDDEIDVKKMLEDSDKKTKAKPKKKIEVEDEVEGIKDAIEDVEELEEELEEEVKSKKKSTKTPEKPEAITDEDEIEDVDNGTDLW